MRPDDFDGWGVGTRFYPMLYVMSRVGGARDLGNGLQLSAGMLGSESQLHLHHVFPKARLYDAGLDKTDVNALANFCFLAAHSNLVISASDPVAYLAEVEATQPGALASQWIPTDPALWHIDRYSDFLTARRELLAGAANDLLDGLLAGTEVPGGDVVSHDPPPAVGSSFEEDPTLLEIQELAAALAVAPPELHFEVTDDESGELLIIADLAWPDGIQQGRTQPVAFLLEPDEEMESRLGELGYRFFVSKARLISHLEGILALDIDGDGIIGAPSPTDDEH